MCGKTAKKKGRTFIQKLTGRGRQKKHVNDTTTKTTSAALGDSIYMRPRYARTELSLSGTIKSIPTIVHHSASSTTTAPCIIKLDVSLQSDSPTIDARNGGECILQCQVSASYTSLPPRMGFDGVIVLDNRLYGRKFAMALEVAGLLVEDMTSSDRLGLVVGGNVVSELIMCTMPYKVALRKSIEGVTKNPAEGKTEGDGLFKGLKLAAQLLSKEARDGGHVFLISDGHCFPESPTMMFNRYGSRITTTHVIAIGELVNETFLRKLRGERGIYIQYRDRMGFDVNEFLGTLTGGYAQGIETVRCRLSYPPEVVITSIYPSSLSLDSALSVTLRKSPVPQNISPLAPCSFLHLTQAISPFPPSCDFANII